VGFIVSVAASGDQYEPIYNPSPIQAPCDNLTMVQVKKALAVGILNSGWLLANNSTDAGTVYAMYTHGKHVANVTIMHDTKSVNVRYMSSTNLGYREIFKEPHIHWRYNQWVNKLEKHIKKQMKISCPQ
jgi:hypothetical protein